MKLTIWFGVLLVLVTAGCSTDSGYSGVENIWRSENPPVWKVGETTEKEVIDVLGPPSQLIGLEKETVYYYLREQRKANGVFLLVYNWKNQKLTYDRAIFFFDQQGKLTKHSYSSEALPYEEAK